MVSLDTDVGRIASWPTRERVNALKRIIPRARVNAVLARHGRSKRFCPRLPDGFRVWFVIAMGMFSRDSYQQVFRWLQWYRPTGVPGRQGLVKEIAEALLPERRNRINPRVIKVKMSRWEKKKPKPLHPPQPGKEFRDAIVMLH
jgi:transposase IS4-like protein